MDLSLITLLFVCNDRYLITTFMHTLVFCVVVLVGDVTGFIGACSSLISFGLAIALMIVTHTDKFTSRVNCELHGSVPWPEIKKTNCVDQ